MATEDDTGVVQSLKQYDVYGSMRASSGSTATKHKFVGNLGHTSEDETGLIYMRARYMDSVTGRFESEDPKQDGGNWFVYCSNNPVNNTDPTGLFDLADVLSAISSIAENIMSIVNNVAIYAMEVYSTSMFRQALVWGVIGAGSAFTMNINNARRSHQPIDFGDAFEDAYLGFGFGFAAGAWGASRWGQGKPPQS